MRNAVSFFPKDELEKATGIFKDNKNVTFSGAGNSSSKALLLSDILRRKEYNVSNVLWVVADKNEVNIVKKALLTWGDSEVFLYRGMKDEERINFSTGGEFERVQKVEMVEFVLRLNLAKNAIFVLNFETLLQDFPDMGQLERRKMVFKKGDSFDSVKFVEDIVNLGYEMTDDRDVLKRGDYYRVGDSIVIYPINGENVLRFEIGFDEIEKISIHNGKEIKGAQLYPIDYDDSGGDIVSIIGERGLIVDDEVDVVDEYYSIWNNFINLANRGCRTLSFTSFNDDVPNHKHLHFLSVLQYRSPYDLSNDLKDKISNGWKTLFFTKKIDEMKGLLRDQGVAFLEGFDEESYGKSSVFLIKVDKEDVFPKSFQTPGQHVLLLSDQDIVFEKDVKARDRDKNVFNDFLTSLKVSDYVVHSDHGIAQFFGLDKKTVDGITKEYLKLGYAENDKLFVPIDQADKVNKYIGSDELRPKLTRLGSAEWNTMTSRVKKETQKIAKELLKLYAERQMAKGNSFKKDNDLQEKFEATFPYDETPGQIKAIEDTKRDMESPRPMDRLICGDVGFGKTEVAMRAAFKSVQSGKQVAIISPITILASQHYKAFKDRMEPFNVRVEMLSRFRTTKEQKVIVEKLKKGEIDVIIGTHRLLQKDIDFKALGLVVIDEEQRFGVKQKEALKEMRKEVDILTLTATPIPRTLNICLNKLRDITTITTPPFGRLPVITEVRKYSPTLVREAILKEVERKGQTYVLHNRVQTIDSSADKLRALIPEATFCVAHGKLGSGDLEERIRDFTNHKYDVLVSSTIIENGIDLANANTLIVNSAERFGLSQLYQLRGRVGRGKKQAYAYFLYHGQRLKLDAKKRLRAIVEASDLGSGFQIAMKDLEIRGAGDILGANQHGVINVVGMSHFMRMLNRAVEDLKAGRVFEGDEEIQNVSVELPIPAYIPDTYIADSKGKISAYQKLSSADDVEYLKEINKEMIEDYGKIPEELDNLFNIIELKIFAKKAGIMGIKAETVSMSKDKEIVMHMSKSVKPANIISLLEENSKWQISGQRLRINIEDLKKPWFAGLKKCVKKLGDKAKHGAKG
ncbi:transcription-repair coupling factor [Candidatus Gracilibacteria bacterium]|nr:transcription-repair coupling factor [Candidatus Gracilibacteria bacterium]